MGRQSRQTILRLKVVYRKDGPIDIDEYKFTCRGHWPGVAIVAQAQMVQWILVYFSCRSRNRSPSPNGLAFLSLAWLGLYFRVSDRIKRSACIAIYIHFSDDKYNWDLRSRGLLVLKIHGPNYPSRQSCHLLGCPVPYSSPFSLIW